MRHVIIFVFIFSATLLSAQTVSTDSLPGKRIYELGTITIIAPKAEDQITQEKNITTNRTNISQSLEVLPAISPARIGSRNEMAVYVRGFDSRAVPLYVDGIPVYVSYDGNIDLGRFKSFDYALVNLNKSHTPMEFGANTLGGSINLVGLKPDSTFQVQAIGGIGSGNKTEYGLNIGSRLNRLYMMGSLYREKFDSFPLSSSFAPTNQEDGGFRENAREDDLSLNFKAGYINKKKLEISVNYNYHKAQKGNPPYAGADERIRVRWWKWPNWDKQSIYLITKIPTGKSSDLKIRVFYDEFYNKLKSFDDSSYSSQTRGYAFTSVFDDNSSGANAVWTLRSGSINKMVASAHYKKDVHREQNEGEPWRTFQDYTLSAGLDDRFRFKPGWTLIGGISFNVRESLSADNFDPGTGEITSFPANSNQAINAQLGLIHEMNKSTQLRFNLAHRTRFPTMKDRYSYRQGFGLPNPGLKPELALHADLSFQTTLFEKLLINASAYFIDLNQTLQNVDNAADSLAQVQNTGSAYFTGLDFSFSYKFYRIFSLNGLYNYIEQKNTSQAGLRFIDVPNHRVMITLMIRPLAKLRLFMEGSYNSKRYSTSFGTLAEPFSLFHIRADYSFKCWTLSGGIQNLLDANYAWSEGYPEAGRNFYLKLIFQFNKNVK